MPDETPSTIILRFRDLSTPEGDTLRLHAQVIGEKGHVWWGWWAKSGERVPREVFGELLAKAESDEGLELFLFDSGRESLHRAVCRSIRWHPGGKPEPSPEPGATPSYYQGRPCPAWFRFSEIAVEPEGDPAAVLRRSSYVRVDDFFESRQSRYEVFYDKQVSSPKELREQDRSTWFVRPFREEDARHEILLTDPRTFSPTHFPEPFLQSRSVNLLWLSDVHFSVDGHHAFPTESSESAAPLATRIERACTEQGVADLGGVILSGDLTWRADPREFAQAAGLVRSLRSWAKLERYQLSVCPGNHDVAYSARPWEPWAPVERAESEARAAYAGFYTEEFYLPPNEFLSCGRKHLLGGAVPVEVVSLNSSLLGQKDGLFQGHGFVGEAQLDDAAARMGWTGDADGPIPLRIVVVHHHLLPVAYREAPVAGRPYSVVLDAEALTRWVIRHRVKVVLHGHMHVPFHSTLERPLRFGDARSHRVHVFGMGSSGVGPGHLGEERRNVFAVLTFSRDALTVAYYSVDPVHPSQEVGRYTIRPWDD